MNEKTILAVNDMTCNHCVARVRQAVQQALPGAEVSVSLDDHRVSFTGDRTKAEEAIREAGYTPEQVV